MQKHMARGANSLCATNLNFYDGGTKKGQPTPGVRDTTVYPEDFGPHIKNSPVPGMLRGPNADPGERIQFGHYPKLTDRQDRYDQEGPRFDKQPRVLVPLPEDGKEGEEQEFEFKGENHASYLPSGHGGRRHNRSQSQLARGGLVAGHAKRSSPIAVRDRPR